MHDSVSLFKSIINGDIFFEILAGKEINIYINIYLILSLITMRTYYMLFYYYKNSTISSTLVLLNYIYEYNRAMKLAHKLF